MMHVMRTFSGHPELAYAHFDGLGGAVKLHKSGNLKSLRVAADFREIYLVTNTSFANVYTARRKYIYLRFRRAFVYTIPTYNIMLFLRFNTVNLLCVY